MQEMYKGSLGGSKKENLKDVKSAKTLFISTPQMQEMYKSSLLGSKKENLKRQSRQQKLYL